MIEASAVLFSTEYAVARRDAGMGFPLFRLFGTTWSPLGPLIWAVPIALALAGGLLLPVARRRVHAAWDRIHEEAAAEAVPAAPVRAEATA